MPLVDSLLTAVVRSDGDALVLHVGEKPYVVASGGQVELSKQGLGLGAMEGMLAQLLSPDALRALREMGAVEHELDDRPSAAGDRFTVVAARGGDDIWIELRRHRRMRAAAFASAPVADATLAPPIAPVTVGSSPAPASAPAAPVLVRPEPEPVVAAAALAPAVEVMSPRQVEATESRPPVAVTNVMAPVPMPEFAPLLAAAARVPAVRYVLPAEPMDAPLVAVAAAVPVVVATATGPEPRPVAVSLAEAVATTQPASGPAATVTPEPEPVAVAAPEPEPVVVPVAMAAPELEIARAPVVTAESTPVVAVRDKPVVVAEPPVANAAVAAAPAPAPERSETPAAPEPVYEPVFDDYGEVAEPAIAARHVEPLMPPVAAPAAAVPAHMVAVEPRVAYRHEPAPRPSPPSAARYEAPAPESVHYAPPEPQPTLPGLAAAHFGGDNARSDNPDAPAVVLSLTRDSARSNAGAVRGGVRPGGIERLLRLASARGASALYLTTQARPAVRVDGDIRLLEGEPALSSGDVEAAVLELAPDGARDKESAEWIRDLADVGRVRITTFRDYRGPGALLRMISAKATSAEQLGLVREIQALATEPEGLVIVTGPRASGKSTLVSAFVDLINRQRNDYVITLEGQIRLVHESRGSLISQREVRGGSNDVVQAARTAMRENPDVLVIEDLRSPDVLQAALDAAGSGLLVFVSVTAASATAALERLVDLCPSEQRRNVRAALAEHLRGVVAQVLLRKAGGGRLAARELVLNTNAVAALVSDGQIAQLPRAIDSGRKLGMAPLNDALVAFVQSGAVDVREAYRKADDKAGLLALLRREGIDTSFVERLA